MPLCLFTTVALWGLLRIVAQQRLAAPSLWLAYMGLGAAVATKGLPIAPLAVYSLGVYCLRTRSHNSLLRLLHPPAMATGLAIAGWWFVAMYLLYGAAAWQTFWADQVTHRLVSSYSLPWKNLLEAMATVIVTSLPWLIPACRHFTSQDHRPEDRATAEQEMATRFLLGWCLMYMGITIFVTEYSHRYLLLIAPSASVLIGTAMAHRTSEQLATCLRWLSAGILVGIFLLGVVSLSIGVQIGRWHSVVVTVAAVCLAFGVVTISQRSPRWTTQTLGIASAIHVTWVLMFVGVGYFALPDQGAQIAKRLQEIDREGRQRIVIWCKPALASKIRLSGQGTLKFRHVDAAETTLQIDSDEWLVTFPGKLSIPPETLRPSEIMSNGYRSLTPIPFLQHLLSGRLRQYLDANQEHFCLRRNDDLAGYHQIARQPVKDAAPPVLR